MTNVCNLTLLLFIYYVTFFIIFNSSTVESRAEKFFFFLKLVVNWTNFSSRTMITVIRVFQ